MILAADIVQVFNDTFRESFNTVLEDGGEEPEYLPATPGEPARIVFRADYAASALHEVAHWCIAGSRRRQLADYGYWYEAQRDEAAQRRFEQVEVKPQALEWILSNAAGLPYRVSCDNFVQDALDLDGFRLSVQQTARAWLCDGLPLRARCFANALYDTNQSVRHYLDPANYQRRPK